MVNIVSRKGLLSAWYQTITWTNADFLSNVPPGTNFEWNFSQNTNIFIQENIFENVINKNDGHFIQSSMC